VIARLVGEPRAVIARLVGEPRAVIALVLLGLALVAGEDLATLQKKLKTGDDVARQKAVDDLAELDQKEAWLLLLDVLKDPSPRVADQAEIALVQARDPAILQELAGRRGVLASEERVAVHAAGALAGTTAKDVPAAILKQALGTKSAEARAILLRGVERMAFVKQLAPDPERSVAKAVEAIVAQKSAGAEVQAAALIALNQLDGALASPMVERLDASMPAPLACAVVRIAAARGGDVARRALEFGVAHPDRSVRAQAVECLAAAPLAENLKLLAGAMATEKNRRLYATIDAHFERLSGLAGSGKVEFWQGWVANLGPEWKPITGDPRRFAPAGSTEGPKLVGLPILSGSLAILVDFSGSTWAKRSDGSTAKDRLDQELAKTLAALPPDTLFNVIPYTDVPIPWEKSLQPATPANVARALKFFTSCKASGKGNAWGAIELALADPAVDTILVLTDGAPTGGTRWNLGLMHARYVDRNRFRHVVLDAVLVDAKGFLRSKWERWCEETGGRMLPVDL